MNISILSSIINHKYFKVGKLNLLKWYLDSLNNVIISIVEDYNNISIDNVYSLSISKFTEIEMLFDNYEYFVKILLSKDFGKTKNIKLKDFKKFNYDLSTYRGLTDLHLAIENNIYLVNQSDKTFTLNLNNEVVNRDKLSYVTNFNISGDELVTGAREFNKSISKEGFRGLDIKLDSQLLKLPVINNYSVEDLYNIYKLPLIFYQLTFNELTFNKVDATNWTKYLSGLKFDDWVKLMNQYCDTYYSKRYSLELIRNVLSKMSYSLNHIYKYSEIDFLTKPFISAGNDYFLPIGLLGIWSSERNFLNFLIKEFPDIKDSKVFNDIYSNYHIQILNEKLSEYNKNNQLVLQKNINSKIGDMDIDYSVYDRKTGNLIIFEGKNFVSPNSYYDNIKLSFKSDSPIQKGISQCNKLISFFNNIKKDQLYNLYGEDIKINKIFAFVITGNGYISLNQDKLDNIRVICVKKTLELLELNRSNLSYLFSDINILADYKYYLKNSFDYEDSRKYTLMKEFDFPYFDDNGEVKDFYKIFIND